MVRSKQIRKRESLRPDLAGLSDQYLEWQNLQVFRRTGADRNRYFFVQYESGIPIFSRDKKLWRRVKSSSYFLESGAHTLRQIAGAIYDLVLTVPVDLGNVVIEGVDHKSDLRSFLTHCLSDPSIIGRLNWQDYKRNIVSSLIDFLAKHEDVYQRELLRLMHEVSQVEDFSHLQRLEEGDKKAADAKAAVQALRTQTIGLKSLFDEEKEIEQRRRKTHETLLQVTAVKKRLEELTREYFRLLSGEEAQSRGFRLEKILRELFELFDLDPKASFRIVGKQIDGAFTFDKTDYLLGAKWQQEPVRAADLDTLAGNSPVS